MKSVWFYIIASLILVLSALLIYIRSVLDSIEFGINLQDINLTDLSSNSIKEGKSFITLKLGFFIKYIGLFDISFTNLNIKAYYNNQLIVSSSDNPENNKKVYLINGVKNYLSHIFDIVINSNTTNLLIKIAKKQKYTINYELSFKVLGLTIKYKSKYENN